MASGGGSVAIGTGPRVRRVGFGALHLTGPDLWGPPADHDGAVRVVRRAVELGVTFIDTADSYGLGASEELLARALHPYPDGLVIATKAGKTRPSAGEWLPLGRPEYLRQQAELSLRRLKVERIDLFQLHCVDPQVPAAEQFGALKTLQEEGKVRDVGLSEVTVEQLEEARRCIDVVSVQNRYNLADRRHEAVVDHCEREGIAFIPWEPLDLGRLTAPDGAVAATAKALGATPAQVAIAWLLRRSPVMLPIPGTRSLRHLAENVASGDLCLSDADFATLSGPVGP
ncbi:aldo/keto reductase [Kitasatospora purpeofusca]|uniref:aldo/keto reductase n=1 Tax=Kitasatospora purpeofusca TaxID=67352 RepID=UPI003F4AEBF1